MRIVRKLFVVPLADNDHGKTTMIRAVVAQGLGRTFQKQKKGARELLTPSGRWVDDYVFGRSFKEVEKRNFGTVESALDGNDAEWRQRELIIMPSHVHDIHSKHDSDDIAQMLEAAHGAGFDAVCASIDHNGNFDLQRAALKAIWCRQWDERWTLANPPQSEFEGQLDALGRDLWFWISRTLVR